MNVCFARKRSSPCTFPVDMVSQSLQEVDNNCVHGSSTMLSECRFDGVVETMELENLISRIV